MEQNHSVLNQENSASKISIGNDVKVKIMDLDDHIERLDEYDEKSEVFYRDHAVRKIGRSVSQDPQVTFQVDNSNRNSQEISRQRHTSTTIQPIVPNKLRRIDSSQSLTSQTIYSKPKSKRDKNGNLVLQLTLAPSIQNSNSFENGSYSTPIPSAFSSDIYGNNVKLRRNGSNVVSPNDSQASFTGFNNMSFVPNGFDFTSYGGSVKGTETVISEANSFVKPSSPEERKYVFRENITIILSIVYAVFIITLGAATYIVDILFNIDPIPQIFSYYIVCVSFLFILYIIIDVRVYMNKKKASNERAKCNADNIEVFEHSDGRFDLSMPASTVTKLHLLPHYYCLGTGRHAGSFYLKIGATVFCLGHLVHCGLILGYQVIYLTSDEETFLECSSIEILILDIIYPIYSFMLLYLIFKYSNIIINRNVPLARFGFMHCIASSLCFWIYTILRETFDSLAFYEPYSNGTTDLNLEYPGHNLRLFSRICEGERGMAIIYQNFSPYLYPFSVEYSILVVGVLYIVWDSISSCKESFDHDSSSTNSSSTNLGKDCDSTFESDEKETQSNLTIHVDCHSSNKGTFAGILFFIVCILSIILFFVAVTDERFQESGTIINIMTQIVILIIMCTAAIWGYYDITKLDINRHHISLLDDVLLFICIPAFFLNMIFSLVPAIYYTNITVIIVIVFEVLQVLIQTPFIIDGLRRCSNHIELRQKKPGREVVTFLIIANVSMWVRETFEISSHDLFDERYEFYGKVVWTILGHVSLPLMMFYRFHASVCLVDIWKYGYEKASH